MLGSVGDVRGGGLPRQAAADRLGPTRRGSMGGRELAPASPEARLGKGGGDGARPRSLSQTRLGPATAELRLPVFANKTAVEAYSQRPEQHASPAPKLAEGRKLLEDIPAKLGGRNKLSFHRPRAARNLEEALNVVTKNAMQPGLRDRRTQLGYVEKRLASADRHLATYISKGGKSGGRFAGLPDQLPANADMATRKAHAVRQSLRELKSDIEVSRKAVAALLDAPAQPKGTRVRLEHALTLARYGFPPTPELQGDMLTFSEANEASREVLGSGAVNTVFKVRYHSQAEPMVYKPLATGPGHVPDSGQNIGIDPDNPRYGQRNIATSVMAEVLGLDIVAKTHLASHGDELGLVMSFAPGMAPNDNDPSPLPISSAERTAVLKAQSGVAAELAKPTNDPAYRSNLLTEFKTTRDLQGLSVNLKTGEWEKHASIADQFDVAGDPSLMHQLCDLEVLDKICAQVDRHPGNYLVDQVREPDGSLGSKLTAIDNDLSFGSKALNPGKAVSHAVPWPAMMSANMHAALIGLEQNWSMPGGPRDKLAPFLTPGELRATESRLFGDKAAEPEIKGLIQYAKELHGQGRVIAADGWDKPTTTRPDGTLGPKPFQIASAMDSKDSYIAKLHRGAQKAARAKA